MTRDRKRPRQETLNGGDIGVAEPLDAMPLWELKELMAPTQHNPGSEEKLALLERRLAHGLPLWVEGDKIDQVSTETRSDVFAMSDECSVDVVDVMD